MASKKKKPTRAKRRSRRERVAGYMKAAKARERKFGSRAYRTRNSGGS